MPRTTGRRAPERGGLTTAAYNRLRRAALRRLLETGGIIVDAGADGPFRGVTRCGRCLTLGRPGGLHIGDSLIAYADSQPDILMARIMVECGNVNARQFGPWLIRAGRLLYGDPGPRFAYADARHLVQVYTNTLRVAAYAYTEDGQRFTAAFDPFLRDAHGELASPLLHRSTPDPAARGFTAGQTNAAPEEVARSQSYEQLYGDAVHRDAPPLDHDRIGAILRGEAPDASPQASQVTRVASERIGVGVRVRERPDGRVAVWTGDSPVFGVTVTTANRGDAVRIITTGGHFTNAAAEAFERNRARELNRDIED